MNGGGVYKSANNGVNWTAIGLENKCVLSLAVSGTNILSGTFDPVTYQGGIFLSTNNGTNWTALNNGLTNQYVYSFVVSGTNIFAGTSNGVYLSTNGGSSWTAAGLTNHYVSSLAVSGINLFAITYMTENYPGEIFLSTNNGTNWSKENLDFDTVLQVNSLLISDNYIFAGTSGESVWRRPFSDLIAQNENNNSNVPDKFSLSQNYPNPFNPITNIKYQIPKSSNVELAVFDITGKEVETLVNENKNAGSYEVNYNASKLVSGIYVYRLTAGDYREIKKMALIK